MWILDRSLSANLMAYGHLLVICGSFCSGTWAYEAQ